MQSVVILLAVLLGAAIANPMVLSPDDIKDQNKDISSSEYLKRIFQQDFVSFEVGMTYHDDLFFKIMELKLVEAFDIAREVDLFSILWEVREAPFITMFLPSDEAVLKWKSELPQQLDVFALKQLVRAWIVPRMVESSDVTNNMMVESHNGAKLRMNVYDEPKQRIITVNGAKIIKSERAATGVIHVVDKVIYPLPFGDVIETLDVSGTFSVMVDLLKRTDLAKLLKAETPVTVLVPTDVAFQAIPEAALDDLKKDPVQLEKVLKYHVINDVRYSASFSPGKDIVASQNDRISVDIENGKIILNGEKAFKATIIKADIPTTNGVIHIIDRVLIPPQKHFVLV